MVIKTINTFITTSTMFAELPHLQHSYVVNQNKVLLSWIHAAHYKRSCRIISKNKMDNIQNLDNVA